MIVQDRTYQVEAVQSIFNYFVNLKGDPVVAMPTATGKSIVIAKFCSTALSTYPTTRILIVTHVKELIQQNYEKLLAVWPFAPAGVYSAGLNSRDHTMPITFCGIASVAKKWALFGRIDLMLIDEAHLVSSNDQTMYQTFIAGLRSINPFMKVIGFTATPWRLGHGHITDPVIDKMGNESPGMFSDVCFDITGLHAFNRLIAEGFLTPLIPKRTSTELVVDGLHMRGGEYIESEVQAAHNKDEITYAALKEAMELAGDRRKWLIFAAGTDHADSIGSMLNSLGRTCGVVHSKRAGRDETLRAFKAGHLEAVVNNNVLTTGFDDPEIDAIICLRASASSPLWVQMLGRGTRTIYAPGHDLTTIQGRLAAIYEGGKHDCLVLDYARNTSRLGPINDPVIPKRKGQKGGTAPVRLCNPDEIYNHPVKGKQQGCDTYNHASVRTCISCGNEFSFEVKFGTESATDDIIRGEMPLIELFKVDHIVYSKHEKIGRPDMLKVTYYCGLERYVDYVCVAHTDWAGRKAQKWWKKRSIHEMPMQIDKAIELVESLSAPTHLRVWVNKKYPEITDYCFDGSAFGTKEADDRVPLVDIDANAFPKVAREALYVEDDEIPF